MSILITASTIAEIQPFLDLHPDADYLITGVGAAPAVYHLMNRIYKNKYHFILQAGLAGTYNEDLALGDSVFVLQDCFADIAVFEKNKIISVFDMGLGNSDEMPFKNGWLFNENKISVATKIKTVKGITVNLLNDHVTYIEAIKLKYNPDVESMEGAALHYVCLQENIPFLQIRGISNKVGERDKSKWNFKEAIQSSNQLLSEIYISLKK